jgi:hypothetical protein
MSIDTRIYLPLLVKTAKANLASLFATAINSLRAITAAASELEKVPIYLEACFLRQSLLKLAQVTIGEVDNSSTV